MGGAKLLREPNPLVGVARRHPNVSHHHIRFRPLHGCAELVEIVCGVDELYIVEIAEDSGDALAGEKAVLAQDYADRHCDDSLTSLDGRTGALGMLTWRVTPAAGSEMTSSSPPTAPIRSRIVTKPIPSNLPPGWKPTPSSAMVRSTRSRSEEHTSELQSRVDLVCRLLLEKKKK